MARPLLVSFLSGPSGPWRIEQLDAVLGESLQQAERLRVLKGSEVDPTEPFLWSLSGYTSNKPRANRPEVKLPLAKQHGLPRPRVTHAALLSIRKTAAWWNLCENTRRSIYKEQSRHIGLDLQSLPAIARRLHHSRDLRGPFDHLTWFQYAPEHTGSFEELLRRLRETREWQYVDREVDIRLIRD